MTSEALKFEWSEADLAPDGMYRGTFDRVEIADEGQYGTPARWVWTAKSPAEHVGRELSVLTTVVDANGKRRQPTPKNKLGRIISGLVGGPLQKGQAFSPADYVGKSYLLHVENGNVKTVLPADG